MSEPKVITKRDDEYCLKRDRAQILTFAQLQEIIQRDVTKTVRKNYTEYTKSMFKQYIASPANNLANIIELSRFLERHSSLYGKIINYYASSPFFRYNITKTGDWSKSNNQGKLIKDFDTVSKAINNFDFKRDMYTAIYNAVRDGMYVGYAIDGGDHNFLMPLDIKYCRIFGRNEAGQWIVYFNATYFNDGNNKVFVEGIDDDMSGTWDDVFIQGWKDYQFDRQNKQWFRLPPERTLCLLAGPDDEFLAPLPLFIGIFELLMDLQDLERLITDKAELENYKLLVNKIPLINGSSDVDDLALSLPLAQAFDKQMDGILPELVGHMLSPGFDIDVITFEKSNSTDDSDALSSSVSNLFNNAGVSQLVVAGGSSTNSVGLKFAIQNDISNIWVFVNRIESWVNYFISNNISEGYHLHFHELTRYNEDEYITQKKDELAFGASLMDYLTACGDTPYIAWNKLNFEKAMGFKSLLEVPATSYTQSGNSEGGRPQKDDDDLSDEGAKTRDGDKNGNTKANS